MTTAFCESLISAKQRRLKSKNETFAELALQVADDANLDPDTVAEQLDELGRSAEELSNAAQLIVDRREWAEQLAAEPQFIAEHNAAYTEMEAATAQHIANLRLLNIEYAERVGELQQRLATIATERDRCQSARNRLTRTSLVHARLSKLSNEHGVLVHDLEGRLPREARQCRPADLGFHKGEIVRSQAAADLLAVEIAELERLALQP